MTNIEVSVPTVYGIEGVRPQVIEGIAEMLRKGRRYFGSSGASLTWQAFNPDYANKGVDSSLAKIGLEGERDTTNVLRKWMEDKPNVVLIDSVHLRGEGKEEVDEETGMIEGGDTDHVLIIGNEVIIIDTKRWKSKANYSVDDNGKVLRSNRPFPGGNVRIVPAIYMWLNYLYSDAEITGIVCINSPETKVFRNRNWFETEYRLVEIDRFIELLDSKWDIVDETNKTTINAVLVAQAAINAVKPYDPRERVLNMDQLATFK